MQVTPASKNINAHGSISLGFDSFEIPWMTLDVKQWALLAVVHAIAEIIYIMTLWRH